MKLPYRRKILLIEFFFIVAFAIMIGIFRLCSAQIRVGPHVVADHDDRGWLNDVDEAVHLPVRIKREIRNDIRQFVGLGVFVPGRRKEGSDDAEFGCDRFIAAMIGFACSNSPNEEA